MLVLTVTTPERVIGINFSDLDRNMFVTSIGFKPLKFSPLMQSIAAPTSILSVMLSVTKVCALVLFFLLPSHGSQGR